MVAGLGLWYALARGRGGRAADRGRRYAPSRSWRSSPSSRPSRDGESDFYRRYGEVGGSPGGIVETAADRSAPRPRGRLRRTRARLPGATRSPRSPSSLLAPLTLVVALPELAINLLSSTPTQTSIHFHYTAAITPALVAGSIFGAARIARRRPQAAVPLAAIAVALALARGLVARPIPLWRTYPGGEDLAADVWRVDEHDRIAERALELVPDDAVVSASNALGAHLSDRRRILSFPYRHDADWVVVDETRPSYADRAVAPVEAAAAVAWLRRDPRLAPRRSRRTACSSFGAGLDRDRLRQQVRAERERDELRRAVVLGRRERDGPDDVPDDEPRRGEHERAGSECRGGRGRAALRGAR